ncbi:MULTISPECIES: haloacid dehalogenase-like hydrolase [Streptomyces]|uniref:Haloacid dehalogenase-like hydrolase n=2 Tax=Streptomyces TaxID=1883 RepID=A0ABU4K3L8_9ACTN|nr:haloacid dehalogenase-like hydrolase [Streptomyces roseolus]MDX2292328.1 haloacid dehalogenase-like hydrolase [Streptomyces roseolus]
MQRQALRRRVQFNSVEQHTVTPVTTVVPHRSWIVLDVDRTLISTTAWYHACTSSGLLLDEKGVQKFLELNDQAYGDAPTMSENDFRRRNLDLINASPLGPWSARRLEEAGAAVAGTLMLYPEVAGYLRHLQDRQDPDLRILFLSAGYRPFITGLVKALLARHLLDNLRYDVVGTSIEFDGGHCRLGTVVDGAFKSSTVTGILDAGDTVALLADDNHHDQPMFDRVERAGGQVVRVTHEPGAQSSRSWREFLTTLPHAELQTRLATGGGGYALADVSGVLTRYRDALTNLPPTDNGIGVGTMERDAFDRAVAGLCELATEDPAERARLRGLLHGFAHVDDGQVRLRGRLFHLCAPPYLFPGPATSRERWHESVDSSLGCLRILEASGALARWGSLPRSWRWVVVGVLDHLKNAATHALDVLTKSSVIDGSLDALDAEIEELLEDCHLAYWSAVFAAPRMRRVLECSAWPRLRRAVDQCAGTPFVIRELDDPQVIAVSALCLAQQLQDGGEWPVGLIDFQSGALDLGLAFRVISRLTRPELPPVGVAHMAYSSKNVMRGLEDEGDLGFDYLISRVPKHFHERVHEWLEGNGSVVLYDNNVTTFSTLANVKRLLGEHANARIRAAVACVNYDNIVRHLRGIPGEPLCADWEDVLDLRPVADYVTAFATWGTSAKTQALHRMYAAPVEAPSLPKAVVRRPGPLFKVCRVHNVFDLAAVVRAGADAIGIHAVSPREPAYSASEVRHVPVLPVTAEPADLPLAHHETAAIRAMTARLPEGLTVAVVVEEAPAAGDWRRICAGLGLPPTVTIQLQCRVTAEETARLRAEATGGLICAIGADQADFAAYFGFLDGLLDPATDHILVDASAHQPDLITAAQRVAAPDTRDAPRPRPGRFPRLAAAMRGNRVPVLVADDVPADVLLERFGELQREGVLVAGCDTQNAVEAPKTAQRYRLIGPDAGVQALIRKSPDRLARWSDALAHHSSPPTARTSTK